MGIKLIYIFVLTNNNKYKIMALEILPSDLHQIKSYSQAVIKNGLGSEGKIKTKQLNQITIYVDGLPQKITSVTIKPTKVKIKTSKVEFKISL